MRLSSWGNVKRPEDGTFRGVSTTGEGDLLNLDETPREALQTESFLRR